jgi:glycogen debranching enzyme
MSSEDLGFNPLQYHNGAVWPHDTALVAAGLRRYGFDDAAAKLIRALFDVAAAFDHRLPEVFSGFARDATNVPIRYPAALVPQAWAAASPLLALRTTLGLDVQDGRLRCEPLASDLVPQLRLRRVAFRDELVDVP